MPVPDFIREWKNNILKTIANEVLVERRIKDKQVIVWRKAVCISNGDTCFNSKDRICTKCECYIDAKATMEIHTNPAKGFRSQVTHCPLGLWNDLEIAIDWAIKDKDFDLIEEIKKTHNINF